MKNNWLLLFLLVMLNSVLIKGQSIDWNIKYHGFLDNREYFHRVQEPQTIFGFNLSPSVTYSVDDVHSLTGGIHFLYEFGDKIRGENISPTMYYEYDKSLLNFKIGAFPRIGITDQLPAIQLYDTINYYRPNIEGLAFKYGNKKSYISTFLDWNSRQSKTSREQFFIGIDGKYSYNRFYIQNSYLMFHNAGTNRNLPSDGIIDNVSNVTGIGVDLSPFIFTDSLTVSAHYVFGYEKNRTTEQISHPQGFIASVYASRSWFAIKNTFYRGDPFNQLMGDHFYRAHEYNRTDLTINFIERKKIQLSLTWSLHFIYRDVNHQQAVRVRVEL